MILQKIISHLNGKITALGYFTKAFDLCELKEKGDKISPMLYCGNGEFKEVFNIDYEKGLTYIRKRSDVSISKEEDQANSCGTYVKIECKLKLVAALKRFPGTITDDNYSPDRIAIKIFKELQNNNDKVLKSLVKSRIAEVFISNYTTDNKSILDNEFKGFDLKDLPTKYSYISMDIDVNIFASTDCLTSDCL